MKKLNNKGFSLVELIIVIAIMAILVGVVGTQVIPYLENSRKSKDIQVLSSWNTAAMSAYSNAAASVDADNDYLITITQSGLTVTVVTPASETAVTDQKGADLVKKYFMEFSGVTATGYNFATMESKEGKKIKNAGNNVKIRVKAAGGQELTVTGADFEAIESK